MAFILECCDVSGKKVGQRNKRKRARRAKGPQTRLKNGSVALLRVYYFATKKDISRQPPRYSIFKGKTNEREAYFNKKCCQNTSVEIQARESTRSIAIKK